MKRALTCCLISVLYILPIHGQGTDDALASPNDVINAFYKALSKDTYEDRVTSMKRLFLQEGSIHVVVQRDPFNASLKGGSYTDFLAGSATFYKKHLMSYDEVERSIDYYVDMASVQSLCFQRIQEVGNPSTIYEQLLWFNFNLVFQNERWYISNVNWINAFDEDPIDNAMQQDTLWHSRR